MPASGRTVPERVYEYRFVADTSDREYDVAGSLKRYRIRASQRLEVIMSDGTAIGSSATSGGFPIFTCIGLGGGGLVGGVGGAAVGGSIGFVIDMLSPGGGGGGAPQEGVSVPIAVLLLVRISASPLRIAWAEYLLLHYLIPRGWSVVNPETLVKPRNLELAVGNTGGGAKWMPTPWEKKKKKSNLKKQGKSIRGKLWEFLRDY